MSECVSGKDSVEQAFDRQELAQAINDFLNTLPKKKYRIRAKLKKFLVWRNLPGCRMKTTTPERGTI